MAKKSIQEADRCQVGRHKDGKYHVWHKVMGRGTRPLTVKSEKLVETVDALLDAFQRQKKENQILTEQLKQISVEVSNNG